jgi:hypothetical protein
MSEHQIVAFRAIDAPVSEKDLEYMRSQSSRATVTARSFDNEYHFGDFRGNVLEMLRRGYDIYLHYANFGIRRLMIRLPHGFPDPAAAEPYLGAEKLRFLSDKTGPGGALAIEPCHEPGDLDEPGDLGALLERLTGLRAEILDGDLRPLYLAHLAISSDMNHDREETMEAPVPAGLGDLTDAQLAMADYYCLSEDLLTVAAEASLPLPPLSDVQSPQAQWLKSVPEAKKNAWLLEWMAGPNSNVRTQLLAEFRAHHNAPSWPTVGKDRTLAQLHAAADKLADNRHQAAQAEAARQRAEKLKSMAADPNKYLAETKQLIRDEGAAAYRKIADLLADLREALVGGPKSALADQHARKLKEAYPSRRTLISELRQKGFLKK